jgi:hypothetical protein
MIVTGGDVHGRYQTRCGLIAQSLKPSVALTASFSACSSASSPVCAPPESRFTTCGCLALAGHPLCGANCGEDATATNVRSQSGLLSHRDQFSASLSINYSECITIKVTGGDAAPAESHPV